MAKDLSRWGGFFEAAVMMPGCYDLGRYIRKAWGKSVLGPTNSIGLF